MVNHKHFRNFILSCLAILFIVHCSMGKNKLFEGYVDPYSLELHADIIKRMDYWNLIHSK
jgi:hypothetical protein